MWFVIIPVPPSALGNFQTSPFWLGLQMEFQVQQVRVSPAWLKFDYKQSPLTEQHPSQNSASTADSDWLLKKTGQQWLKIDFVYQRHLWNFNIILSNPPRHTLLCSDACDTIGHSGHKKRLVLPWGGGVAARFRRSQTRIYWVRTKALSSSSFKATPARKYSSRMVCEIISLSCASGSTGAGCGGGVGTHLEIKIINKLRVTKVQKT